MKYYKSLYKIDKPFSHNAAKDRNVGIKAFLYPFLNENYKKITKVIKLIN